MSSQDDNNDEHAPSHFLDTLEGEISFFRSLMRARPVGIHRHFHVLAMRNAIHRDTGHWVATDDIWSKLKSCYDLDILENIEADGYDTPNTMSPSMPVPSPSPSEDLLSHPYFRQEYHLPNDPFIDNLIAQRRMRGTASLPSTSPTPPPIPVEKPTKGVKKGKNKLKNAGLVGGDSDSSALTQESGDESVSPVARLGSVATGTDAGTEYAEEEDVVMDEPSPAEPLSSKTKKSSKKRAAPSGGTTKKSSASRSKKRKR
ncbi:hypothetical protein C8Q75DRAFT_764747 [Abortiporus biennis]|nr:hypothetical protein C8Q75DRAFT_764747 [Abortiporus biennis]